MAEDLASFNLLVLGRVQGVFFRASTLEQAQQLNLTGYVQNLADGSVEIEAEGSRHALDELLQWCRRGGPPGANVEDVIVRWGPHRNGHRTFLVKR